jgi:hypothetical protein
MFVVKTLTVDPIYKAFAALGAAERWAQDSAYLEHGAKQCQIYRTVAGLTRQQAIAAVKVGKAERLLTVLRRIRGGSQDTDVSS